jgi:L-cysteine:1D-myo-inositol 2-amino-2-deoxy-alpha-D-glucopyranoside ligase
VRLFDTATGSVVEFTPGEVVRLYTCGITPYDATHVGHAATYITYDVLHRRLLDLGHEVRVVRNITDVDDDLLARARRDRVNYLDLAFGQKRRFDEDLCRLGNLEPWSEPRATSAIPDIRGMISALIDSGGAYVAGESVYFDHSASPVFGSVSGYDEAQMLEAGRNKGEDPDDEHKQHPLDTVLWKPSLDDEPAWESPWGRGRPGWHVECAALSLREHGPHVDIHGGGCDLVYPHHEFFAAQTDAVSAGGVGLWMHQSCVELNGEHMAKSTGNLVFVHDLFVTHPAPVVRLAVLSRHYRTKPWDWDVQLLDAAAQRWDLWRSSAGEGSAALDDVRTALDNDLDVPTALMAIDEAAKSGKGVSAAANLLGVSLADAPPDCER